MLVSTHLSYLLKQLQQNPSSGWVLATVVSKFRSSYRQPGAMMLVDPDGHSFGLVSGGCLEADIRLNARKVLASGQPKCVLYDSTDEGSVAAELGLGCNGRVEVLVQPLMETQRVVLLELLQRIESGQDSYLLQCIESETPEELNALYLLDDLAQPISEASGSGLPKINDKDFSKHQLIHEGSRRWSLNRHNRPARLWVMGGGEDAQPLVRMAASMNWEVTLIDHRPAFAREADFPQVKRIIRQSPGDLDRGIDADAAIIMSHNLELDAGWLARLQGSKTLRYIGLLGPIERKQEVLELAGIGRDSSLDGLLRGPMGFDIGGDSPESVALSTIAQCHQVLFKEGGL